LLTQSWSISGGAKVRKITKLPCPEVLQQNANSWSQAFLADPNNSTKRNRYRHRDIKETLLRETNDKCVYCESKVGHNTPGDVEHKTPSSKQPHLHFSWENLTIACTECNRRKSDYFDPNVPFLDPYSDDVEERVIHLGPLVSWRPGDNSAEVTVRMLELHDHSRDDLIKRKIEAIDKLNNLVARYLNENGVLREMIYLLIERMKSPESEFSAMNLSICRTYEIE